MNLPPLEINRIIDTALSEDMSTGDITTSSLVPQELQGTGSVLIKEDGILAGIQVLAKVFERLDTSLKTTILIEDGTVIRKGDIVAIVEGRAASIMTAERVALNLLQRMSGIATLTSQYVQRVADLNVRVVDTRKTTPGLRILEKYAVRVGGGGNHRLSLADGVLIKDNHIALLRREGLSLRDIIDRAKRNVPHTVKIEIEVTSAEDARQAAEAGADIILLDNMPIEDMKMAVGIIGGKAETEASGGIRLENLRSVALTGVDLISVGALIHSARSLDISIELEFKLP